MKTSSKTFFREKTILIWEAKQTLCRRCFVVYQHENSQSFLLLVFYFIVKRKMSGHVMLLHKQNTFETYQKVKYYTLWKQPIIMFTISSNFLTVEPIFVSPQEKWRVIISNKLVFWLPYELSKDVKLRLLRN